MTYVVDMVSFHKDKEKWFRWGSLEMFIPLSKGRPPEYGLTLFIGRTLDVFGGEILEGLGYPVTALYKTGYDRGHIPLCGQCLREIRKTLLELKGSAIGTTVAWRCGVCSPAPKDRPPITAHRFTCLSEIYDKPLELGDTVKILPNRYLAWLQHLPDLYTGDLQQLVGLRGVIAKIGSLSGETAYTLKIGGEWLFLYFHQQHLERIRSL